MGMWDYVWSSADSLKRNAPDLSAVKGLCGASYAHGLAAAAAVSNVGSNQLHSLKQYTPDDEARRKIGRFTMLLAKNAALEYHKFIPGGEIVGNTLKDFRKWEDDHRAQAVTEKVLEEDGSRRKLVSKDVEIYKASDEGYFKSQAALNRLADQKPEDVIRTFMMKGFMGRQFLDDLMVPVPGEAPPYRKNK